MREILFRGKRKTDGKWIQGMFLHLNLGRDFICDGTVWIGTLQPCKEEVVTETVGQFTGYTDVNGTKIFEGDVFQLEDDIIGVVDYNHGCFFLTEYGMRGAWTESGYDEYGGGWGVIDHEPMHFWHINKLEIIGNIYDNPEFLEVR